MLALSAVNSELAPFGARSQIDRSGVSTSPIDDDDLDGRIAALESELRELRQQQRDRDDWRLLSAIVQVTGKGIFDTTDLFRLAPRVPALRDALTGWTPNHLGRRLMHLTNRPCGPFLVQFVERSSRGRVYTIVPRHREPSDSPAGAA